MRWFPHIAPIWDWLRTSLWPQAGSNLASFALGLVSGMFLQNRADKRAARKRLSENVLRPFRKQLAEIQTEVLAKMRPLHWDAAFWRNVQTSGDFDRLPSTVRQKLPSLFDVLLPKYDKAWMDANEAFKTFGPKFDSDYGRMHSSHVMSARTFSWWDFMTNDSCRPPFTDLQPGMVIRLWNSYIDSTGLQQSGLTLTEIFSRLWEEGQTIPTLRSCKELRKDILKQIPEAIKALDRGIGD